MRDKELPRRRLLLLFAAAATVTAALVWSVQLHLQPIDDAYITFRAAVNLAHGDGPVFNPGERVESATSPLWVLLLAAAERLGVGPEASWAPLSLGFAAAAAALSAFCAFELGGLLAAVIASLFLAVTPAWSAWAGTGMEVSLAGLCAISAVTVAARQRPVLGGLLFALAVLARPEAMFLFPALLLATPRARWVPLLCAGFVPLGALLLARYAYFGAWVPNTYVAKRQGLGAAAVLRGLLYVGGFAAGNPVMVAATFRSAARSGLARVLAVACIGFAAAVAYEGGDHFSLSRLLSPTLPMGFALFGAELAALPRRWLPLALGLAVAVPFVLPEPLRIDSPATGWKMLSREAQVVRDMLETGAAVSQLPPGRVAVVTIGAIGFETGRNILDLVGLTDARIARSPHQEGALSGHDHADNEYVLAQRPEFVLLVPVLAPMAVTTKMEDEWLRVRDRPFRAAHLLSADPRFRALYEPRDYLVPDGRRLHIWQLRR
ncbi:MAG TPA: hypothetical protein VH083_27740 [Myxococcales bacterium]|nr:hypothetical protein [Myxococcales bacterium]